MAWDESYTGTSDLWMSHPSTDLDQLDRRLRRPSPWFRSICPSKGGDLAARSCEAWWPVLGWLGWQGCSQTVGTPGYCLSGCQRGERRIPHSAATLVLRWLRYLAGEVLMRTERAGTTGSGPQVWAHSPNSSGLWHQLSDHLRGTAELASRFAEPFGGGQVAW
jgi:hypothetical protein